MKKIINTASSLAVIAIFASCGSSNLTKRLPGTWNIVAYKEQNADLSESNATNIGVLSFNKKGSGEKRINYRIIQNKVSDTASFKWVSTEANVRITEGDNKAKTWIIEKNEKNYQLWKSTDGEGNMQQMELKKQ